MILNVACDVQEQEDKKNKKRYADEAFVTISFGFRPLLSIKPK